MDGESDVLPNAFLGWKVASLASQRSRGPRPSRLHWAKACAAHEVREKHHLVWILVDLKKRQFRHLGVMACVIDAFVLPCLKLKMRRCSVAAGSYHTCAITVGGQLSIFGDTFREYTDYGQRSVPCGLGRVLSVSAGNCHTCAVKANGELVCFGHDYAGQCRSPSDLGPVLAVSAGRDHTCAIRVGGELVCFGGNRYGQCDIPPNLGPVVAVAAGMHHTCAIKADGQLVCFGDNEYGQCGVPAELRGAVAVAAGAFHTCAITADGSLWCFGLRDDGQCDVPNSLGPAKAVAAGALHTCVLLRSGRLTCFGSNLYGQCAVPRNLGPVVAVAAGESMTCAVSEDSRLVCFGRHKHGQCNVPSDLGPVHVLEKQLHFFIGGKGIIAVIIGCERLAGSRHQLWPWLRSWRAVAAQRPFAPSQQSPVDAGVPVSASAAGSILCRWVERSKCLSLSVAWLSWLSCMADLRRDKELRTAEEAVEKLFASCQERIASEVSRRRAVKDAALRFMASGSNENAPVVRALRAWHELVPRMKLERCEEQRRQLSQRAQKLSSAELRLLQRRNVALSRTRLRLCFVAWRLAALSRQLPALRRQAERRKVLESEATRTDRRMGYLETALSRLVQGGLAAAGAESLGLPRPPQGGTA
eukprot:s802_g12.t2